MQRKKFIIKYPQLNVIQILLCAIKYDRHYNYTEIKAFKFCQNCIRNQSQNDFRTEFQCSIDCNTHCYQKHAQAPGVARHTPSVSHLPGLPKFTKSCVFCALACLGNETLGSSGARLSETGFLKKPGSHPTETLPFEKKSPNPTLLHMHCVLFARRCLLRLLVFISFSASLPPLPPRPCFLQRIIVSSMSSPLPLRYLLYLLSFDASSFPYCLPLCYVSSRHCLLPVDPSFVALHPSPCVLLCYVSSYSASPLPLLHHILHCVVTSSDVLSYVLLCHHNKGSDDEGMESNSEVVRKVYCMQATTATNSLYDMRSKI